MEAEKEIKELEAELNRLEDEPQSGKLKLELTDRIIAKRKEAYSNLEPEDKVYLARHPLRPNAKFYIDELFSDYLELHGDRLYGDDGSIMGFLALFEDIPVTVIAQVKGKSLEENIQRNFGMPHPEGYRKALRLAKQAEKFNRPIITFIDTPGAYPGLGAEERGQASAIAQCLMQFMGISTPVIAIVIGEGGSGGALALSCADHIVMFEHSTYSILSPEGFASILWKDSSRAREAAKLMKLTAKDLHQFKIIDTIIKEPIGGIHIQADFVSMQLKDVISKELKNLMAQEKSVLLQNRYKKFRDMGKEYV